MSATKTHTILARQIINLIHSRFDEAWRLPGGAVHVTVPDPDPSGFMIESMVLCGSLDGVYLQRSTANTFKVSFTNPDRPAYEWKLTGYEEPRVEFHGADNECPSLEEQIAKVRDLPVGLNALVPYGWVDGHLVTTVLYCAGVTVVSTEPLTWALGHTAYTLEGHELPEPLKLVPGEGADWVGRMWSLILQGKLVRLSTRINAMHKELPVRGVFDGQNLAYLIFSDHGYWKPQLVVGEHYTTRAINPNGPAFDAATHYGGKPYDVELNTRFR